MKSRTMTGSKTTKIWKWFLAGLAVVLLVPLAAGAAETTLPGTPTTVQTPPRDGSGNQYRKAENGGYSVSAEELGLRRRTGTPVDSGDQQLNRQRLRDQSGSGSQMRHRYNGTKGSGSYGGGNYGTGSYGGGSYGSGHRGGGHGRGRR